ncbi:MAG: GAF domain-containing protein [Thermomicrobiales bacterium]|nr:GAF domain-containing protein [Thermomicrobiales bacterium]
MPMRVMINAISEELSDELGQLLRDPAQRPDPVLVRHMFGRVAAQAMANGVPLEDAMVTAAKVMGDHFTDRQSPQSYRDICGLGLAQIARVYLANQDEHEIEHADPANPIVRLGALHRINRAATANLQLGDMLETIVKVVAETTGSDDCAVFLYDATTDTLALKAAIGLEPSAIGALTIRPGTGITGRAAAEGQPIIAHDSASHPSHVAIPGVGDHQYTSQASIPMMIRGANRLVGVMNIYSIEGRTWDDDDVAFFQTVAGELAISIENARLYSYTDAKLRRKVAELGTLQRVSRKIASSLDLEGVLRAITEAARELTQSEAAAFFSIDEDDTARIPTIDYVVGMPLDVVEPETRHRLIRKVIDTGSSHSAVLDYVDEGTRRLYCIPLRSARHQLGALCLRLADEVEMTEDQLGMLQAFSDSASIAIENARLYDELRQGLVTTSALLQEMHHRVRNNLQTVAALLSLQMRQAEDETSASALKDAVGRIQAIAGVHDLLSDERRLSGATIDQIARLVAEEAYQTMVRPGLRLTFDIPPTDINVPSRTATILALLINELVSNAVRHGFSGRDAGTISIRAHRRGDLATIEVENDGQRIDEGFNPAGSRGLGMRIVSRLVTSDLRGHFQIEPSDEGTLAKITFPVERIASTDRLLEVPMRVSR